MSQYVIEHLGKTFPTKHMSNLTKKQCAHIRDHFFDGPEQPLVDKQIQSLRKGTVKINHICERYFFELMCDCRRKDQKWSIKQFLENDDLIRYAVAKTEAFPGIYHPEFGVNKNLRILFRLSPSSAAAKIGNFPYKTAKEIVQTYNVNDNVYDFSCGWGVRLAACLSNDLNYYGTDPNRALVVKLKELTKRFHTITDCKSKVDIKPHGSEKYIPQWKGKIGLAFSSPPYFDLEEYSLSDKRGQSTQTHADYDRWLKNYMGGTLSNIKQYLVKDGYLVLNIKNIGRYNMFDDCMGLAEKMGFEMVEIASFTPTINGYKRPNGNPNLERIMVLQKAK